MLGAARVAIGVHVHAEPERLQATLAALQNNTPEPHESVVIPDGADAAVRSYLTGRSDLRVLEDPGPRGGAACLNRLRHASRAEVIVLLESGCRVAPAWLPALLEPLALTRTAGLAGPSTNRCWNEQGAYPSAGESDAEIARTAADARARFGASARRLAPLYSLADFCYAVRREVFDAIGEADEGYGTGPCWEMDFNVRAARGGFDGLWAGASYVWRAPFTPRRQRDEAALFETNRHRYQDRFCGARVCGRVAYRSHCRGDACPDFAPVQLIRATNGRAPAPLVSCIMPTSDRRAFIPLALRCFKEQTYRHRELIVVDDGTDPVSDVVSGVEGVRYIRVAPRESIGAKRNRACAEARGAVIVHWDDDDWYARDRLERQVMPILRGAADITGLQNEFILQMPARRFWSTNPDLHRSMFVGDVHGGTLAYRRSVWAAGVRYPEIDLAEDARWLLTATGQGYRLLKVENRGSFVYLRHSRNAWRFDAGSFLNPSGWRESKAPCGFSAENLEAYAAASASLS